MLNLKSPSMNLLYIFNQKNVKTDRPTPAAMRNVIDYLKLIQRLPYNVFGFKF